MVSKGSSGALMIKIERDSAGKPIHPTWKDRWGTRGGVGGRERAGKTETGHHLPLECTPRIALCGHLEAA